MPDGWRPHGRPRNCTHMRGDAEEKKQQQGCNDGLHGCSPGGARGERNAFGHLKTRAKFTATPQRGTSRLRSHHNNVKEYKE